MIRFALANIGWSGQLQYKTKTASNFSGAVYLDGSIVAKTKTSRLPGTEELAAEKILSCCARVPDQDHAYRYMLPFARCLSVSKRASSGVYVRWCRS